MPTQAERTDATTGVLLDAARQLFGEKGYAATATEDIVAATRVTRGALYHHFGNKLGLFSAVFEREEGRLAQEIVRAAAASRDPAEKVRIGCRVFLEACLDPHFQRIHLLDGPAVLGAGRVRQVESAHTYSMLLASLRAAERNGSRRGGDVEVRASMLFGALCEAGLHVARSDDPRRTLKAALAELDPLLNGLLGTDAARPRARRTTAAR